MAEIGERVANQEARIDAHAQELADIRQSVNRLEDKMEARFQEVNARFLSLEHRMAEGFREVRTDMHAQFRWMMGGMAGAVVTVIVAVVGAMFAMRP